MKTFSLVLTLSMALFSAPAFADGNWNSTNNPANMNAHYDYVYNHLPQTGAVDPAHMPWSDNYWESDWGGIQLRWNTLTVAERDPDLFDYEHVNKSKLFSYTPPTLAQLKGMTRDQISNLSPAEKYDIYMGRYDYPTVKYERANTSPSMSDWQGICHGWVPAAINEREPRAKDAVNPDGIVVPFGSSDIKGVLAFYYGVSGYNFARGDRKVARSGSLFQVLDQLDASDPISWLNLAANAVVYENNREIEPSALKDASTCADPVVWTPYGSQEKCIEAFAIQGYVVDLDLVAQVGSRSGGSDPNPGAFHIVMANQLGLMHQAFAGNINKYLKKGQIWNQPVTSYETKVNSDHRAADGSGYVGVTTTLTYVTEIPQNFDAVVGTPNQRFSTMVFGYTLDIDHSGKIVGGSWDSRYHPSFLWSHEKLPIKGYYSKVSTLY